MIERYNSYFEMYFNNWLGFVMLKHASHISFCIFICNFFFFLSTDGFWYFEILAC
jgi:hypothetical protein